MRKRTKQKSDIKLYNFGYDFSQPAKKSERKNECGRDVERLGEKLNANGQHTQTKISR